MSACDWEELPRKATARQVACRILAILRVWIRYDFTRHDELGDLAGRLARLVTKKAKRRKP